MEFLLKGLVFGFSIAAPVGPIGLLCIRRTLAESRLSGFVSGLGAASADAFYGFVAAFGLTAVSGFLLLYETPIRLLGACFLFYLAITIFLSKPADHQAKGAIDVNIVQSYISTLFLTLTNPVTILSFIAVFAALGVGIGNDYFSATYMVIGVFIGSALWWLLLSSFVGLFATKFSTTGMTWVNRISAVLMSLLGIFSLVG